MLVIHMTLINKIITEPHDSACFSSVTLAFLSVLYKNVDNDQSTKTSEVYVCENGFEYVGDVTEGKNKTGHMIGVDDRKVDIPNILVPFLESNKSYFGGGILFTDISLFAFCFGAFLALGIGFLVSAPLDVVYNFKDDVED